MPTISKRTKQARNLIIKPSYSLEEGVKILKQTATTKFVESAEAHFNLNLDTKYSDQQLRTTITLPRGTGKEITIAVLTSSSANTEEIINAGASIVGSDDLIEKILYEPKVGYYSSKDPFGKNGDFITSPTISNLFSEIIAIWLISAWEKMGKPKIFNFIEKFFNFF